jgi:hypothetical protein
MEPIILLFVDNLLVLGFGRKENISIIFNLEMNFEFFISSAI